MKYLIGVILSVLLCFNSFADDESSNGNGLYTTASIFSTTVDWSAVTGLPLRQYIGKIVGTNKDFVKKGLVLYYLDSFPCYGQADSVTVWVSANGKMDGNLRLVCVHKPESISFAWRNANKEALDAKTTGIVTCPVSGNTDFSIDISKCEIGKEWKEYR